MTAPAHSTAEPAVEPQPRLRAPPAPVPEPPLRRTSLRPAKLAPSRILRRSCACDESDASPCRSCASGVPGALRRASAAGADLLAGTPAPASVHRVLASPGERLPAELRTDFEPRLGVDLGSVRLHHDAAAVTSATAVGARAYTVGRDVVFGAGVYDPASSRGRRLIAHELAHVAQEGAGPPGTGELLVGASDDERERAAEVVANATSSGAPAPTAGAAATRTLPPPRGAGREVLRRAPAGLPKPSSDGQVTLVGGFVMPVRAGCTAEQWRQIGSAVSRAQRMLYGADQALSRFIAGPALPSAALAADALRRHFKSTDWDVGRFVFDRVRQIGQQLARSFGSGSLMVECPRFGATITCASSEAAVTDPPDRHLVLCPSFFSFFQNEDDPPTTLVHEMAHLLFPASGPLHVADRAYHGERQLENLSRDEALTNAQSYAELVRELGAGGRALKEGEWQQREPPTDRVSGCLFEWSAKAERALAAAERWNTEIRFGLENRYPEIAPIAGRILGSRSNEVLTAARDESSALSGLLESPVAMECVSQTPECGTRDVYVTPGRSPAVHLCPGWRAMPAQEDRVETLLAALFELQKQGTDLHRFRTLARLARAVHFSSSYAPPAHTEVERALKAPYSGAGPVLPPRGP